MYEQQCTRTMYIVLYNVQYILYNVCAMILVRLGVIFFTSLRQECHVKIKAKCHNFLVKVPQMARVP